MWQELADDDRNLLDLTGKVKQPSMDKTSEFKIENTPLVAPHFEEGYTTCMAEPLTAPSTPEWLTEIYEAEPFITSLALNGIRQMTSGTDRWDRNTNCARGKADLGTAMAYFAANLATGTLRELDRRAPAEGRATIIQTPAGEAPEELRQELVGKHFYFRPAIQPDFDVVAVHPLDFTIELYDSGALEAAAWYRSFANQQLVNGEAVQFWGFRADEVEVQHSERTGKSHAYIANAFRSGMLGLLSTEFLIPHELDLKGHYGGIVSISESLRPDTTRQQEHFEDLANAYYDGDIAQAINSKAMQYVFMMAHDRAVIADHFDRSSVGVTYDPESGEVLNYRLHGEVIFDKEQGIDIRDQHPRLVPERVAPQSPEEAERFRLYPPHLPALPADQLSWHIQRHIAGL